MRNIANENKKFVDFITNNYSKKMTMLERKKRLIVEKMF
jgi:hypothetical protein